MYVCSLLTMTCAIEIHRTDTYVLQEILECNGCDSDLYMNYSVCMGVCYLSLKSRVILKNGCVTFSERF